MFTLTDTYFAKKIAGAGIGTHNLLTHIFTPFLSQICISLTNHFTVIKSQHTGGPKSSH